MQSLPAAILKLAYWTLVYYGVTLSEPSHIHTTQRTPGPTCVDLWHKWGLAYLSSHNLLADYPLASPLMCPDSTWFTFDFTFNICYASSGTSYGPVSVSLFVCLCLCLHVTSLYSIKRKEQINLDFGIEAFFDQSYTVF